MCAGSAFAGERDIGGAAGELRGRGRALVVELDDGVELQRSPGVGVDRRRRFVGEVLEHRGGAGGFGARVDDDCATALEGADLTDRELRFSGGEASELDVERHRLARIEPELDVRDDDGGTCDRRWQRHRLRACAAGERDQGESPHPPKNG